ncbi:MAG: hypothetical protein V8R51_01170 [Clostridia bacterium]
MKKIILSSLIFIMLMVSLIGTACAASLGTIQFVAINNTDSKVVENLEISIYQVSKQDEQGNFSFAVGFENCTLNIDDLSESNLQNLKDYAKTNASPVFTKITDSNGRFNLNNLELGTYLFIQENKEDEITMQTMLISVPELTTENGLKYDVTVKPKILNKEIVNKNENQRTEVAKDEQLPYTGVLNWPIPVLVVAGIAIFCVAWLKVYSTSKKKVK